MSHDIPLSERLAGFLPEEPAPMPYTVPQQAAFPPDAHVPGWHQEEHAPAPTTAPRRAGRNDPTVIVAPNPTRRIVPATAPIPVAASSAVQPWEWDDRRGMRVAVLVASVTLVLGAAAAGVILLRGQQPVAQTAEAPDPDLPVPAEIASIPALDAGLGGIGSRPAVVPAAPASISPVTLPPPTTATTRRPPSTQKPPASQAVVATQPTLNPPNPPVKPTQPPRATSTTGKPEATTTTSTTTKPPATTTTTRGNNGR
jgi:hypothetical protein